MTLWSALVPLKTGPASKSRLASTLSQVQREALSRDMAAHVIAILAKVRRVDRVLLLSPTPIANIPAQWLRDKGRGLNTELSTAAVTCMPLVVVLADLPTLAVDDISTLLACAEKHGAAIAPDRHDRGTNAVALAAARDFAFAFGENSFARHRAKLGRPAIVRRPGLANDIDTLEDLGCCP